MIGPESYSSLTRWTDAPLFVSLAASTARWTEAVHSLPAELRKQRGMRVQNAAAKAGQGSGADLLHIACEDDGIHGVLDQGGADRSVQRLGFRMRRAGEVVGRDAGRPCSLKGQ
jgi:hypothetical protein